MGRACMDITPTASDRADWWEVSRLDYPLGDYAVVVGGSRISQPGWAAASLDLGQASEQAWESAGANMAGWPMVADSAMTGDSTRVLELRATGVGDVAARLAREWRFSTYPLIGHELVAAVAGVSGPGGRSVRMGLESFDSAGASLGTLYTPYFTEAGTGTAITIASTVLSLAGTATASIVIEVAGAGAGERHQVDNIVSRPDRIAFCDETPPRGTAIAYRVRGFRLFPTRLDESDYVASAYGSCATLTVEGDCVTWLKGTLHPLSPRAEPINIAICAAGPASSSSTELLALLEPLATTTYAPAANGLKGEVATLRIAFGLESEWCRFEALRATQRAVYLMTPLQGCPTTSDTPLIARWVRLGPVRVVTHHRRHPGQWVRIVDITATAVPAPSDPEGHTWRF